MAAMMAQDPEKQVSAQDDPEVNVPIEQDTTAHSSEKSSVNHETPIENDPPKVPYNPWMDPAGFPDGGLHAWLSVAAASACFFVSWGYVPTFNFCCGLWC